MEDYPAEMKDILAADPTLAKEIEYDMRRHEERRQEAELMRQVDIIEWHEAPRGVAAAGGTIASGTSSTGRWKKMKRGAMKRNNSYFARVLQAYRLQCFKLHELIF